MVMAGANENDRAAVGLIDNLHRNGIAFSLSVVHEGGSQFLRQEATPTSDAVDNAVP